MEEWLSLLTHPLSPPIWGALAWVFRREVLSWPPEAVDEFVANLGEGNENRFRGSVMAVRFFYPIFSVFTAVSAVAVAIGWLVG